MFVDIILIVGVFFTIGMIRVALGLLKDTLYLMQQQAKATSQMVSYIDVHFKHLDKHLIDLKSTTFMNSAHIPADKSLSLKIEALHAEIGNIHKLLLIASEPKKVKPK